MSSDDDFTVYEEAAVRDQVLEALWSELKELREAHQDLSKTVVDLLEGRAATDGEDAPEEEALVPWTRGWPSESAWDELVDWVDLMVDAHAVTVLPACWPSHEGLVNEIHATRMAWRAAMLALQAGPTSALASWYAYHWDPLLRRLGEVSARCRVLHSPDPAPQHTDRRYIPTTPPVDEAHPLSLVSQA